MIIIVKNIRKIPFMHGNVIESNRLNNIIL